MLQPTPTGQRQSCAPLGRALEPRPAPRPPNHSPVTAPVWPHRSDHTPPPVPEAPLLPLPPLPAPSPSQALAPISPHLWGRGGGTAPPPLTGSHCRGADTRDGVGGMTRPQRRRGRDCGTRAMDSHCELGGQGASSWPRPPSAPLPPPLWPKVKRIRGLSELEEGGWNLAHPPPFIYRTVRPRERQGLAQSHTAMGRPKMGCPPHPHQMRGAGLGLLGVRGQATLWERSRSQTQSALHHLQACLVPVDRGCFTEGLVP